MNMLLKELSTINMKLFFFDFYREAFFLRYDTRSKFTLTATDNYDYNFPK